MSLLCKKNYFDKISSFKKYLAKIFFYRRRIKHVKKHLKQGLYVLQSDMLTVRNVFDINSGKKNESKNFITISRILKKILRVFGCSIYVVRKAQFSNNEFLGDLIIFSNKNSDEIQYGDLKIFDKKNSLIYSIFYTQLSFYNNYTKSQVMSKKFPTSEIVSVDCNKQMIVENYIEHIDSKAISTEQLMSIQRNLQKLYFGYLSQEYEEGRFRYYNLSKIFDVNLIIKSYPCLGKMRKKMESSCKIVKYPNFYQHGDLSISNILLKPDGDIILIDWEHADFFGCFYDMHFHFLNQAISGNFKPLELYINNFVKNEFNLTNALMGIDLVYEPYKSTIVMSLMELLIKRYIPFDYEIDAENLNKLSEIIMNPHTVTQ